MSAQPDAFTVPADPDPMSYDRKVLFVAGAGRSGTSTMAGLMKIMGLHVPQRRRQRRQPLEREVLTCERDEHRVSGH